MSAIYNIYLIYTSQIKAKKGLVWYHKNRPVLALPNHQHTLKMGMKIVPETSENFHILTWISAWENFIE